MGEHATVAIPEGWPSTTADLHARIEQGYTELQAFLAPLNEQQLSAMPNADGWMLKDHLAHLAVWEAGIIALMGQKSRPQGMGVPLDVWERMLATGDYDEVNALIFEQHRAKSTAEVQAMLASTHAETLATLAALSDHDLARAYPDGEGGMAPLVGWLMGNTYEHYAEHIEWMREQL
jgi:hypothetical protein